MDMVIDSPISEKVQDIQAVMEWDESNWELSDFHDAFQANLNLDAPFES